MGGAGIAATNLTGIRNVNAVALAVGGTGGSGWKIGANNSPGAGAPGGNATATATGTATGDNSVSVLASAFGGSGGANSGSGGTATATAFGSSGSGPVQVSASATGGAGGSLDLSLVDPHGNIAGAEWRRWGRSEPDQRSKRVNDRFALSLPICDRRRWRIGPIWCELHLMAVRVEMPLRR